MSGECLGKISCVKPAKANQLTPLVNPLEDISALYYNEARNEIYTGNADGKVCIWSS